MSPVSWVALLDDLAQKAERMCADPVLLDAGVALNTAIQSARMGWRSAADLGRKCDQLEASLEAAHARHLAECERLHERMVMLDGALMRARPAEREANTR